MKSCGSESLNEKIKAGCHDDLRNLRQCWVHNVQRCVSPRGVLPIAAFNSCYGKYNTSADLQCLHNFEEKCKSYSVHATKVHRLRMDTVEELLLKIPDLYIIYYIRDPRGIYVSRKGLYQLPPMAKLCEQMQEDFEKYNILKTKFPGVILKVKYEDLAGDPHNTLNTIYKHINAVIPQDVVKFIEEATTGTHAGDKKSAHGVFRENSTRTANAWREKISAKILDEASDVCKKVLENLNYI